MYRVLFTVKVYRVSFSALGAFSTRVNILKYAACKAKLTKIWGTYLVYTGNVWQMSIKGHSGVIRCISDFSTTIYLENGPSWSKPPWNLEIRYASDAYIVYLNSWPCSVQGYIGSYGTLASKWPVYESGWSWGATHWNLRLWNTSTWVPLCFEIVVYRLHLLHFLSIQCHFGLVAICTWLLGINVTSSYLTSDQADR